MVPWWRRAHPIVGLVTAIVALALISLIAQAGLWRRRMLGPLGAVAAITALVLGFDVVFNATLQQTSLMGYSPLVAGRFYGFGNQAVTLFATGAVLSAAGFAEPYLRQGRRRAAISLVAVAGAAVVIVEGPCPGAPTSAGSSRSFRRSSCWGWGGRV